MCMLLLVRMAHYETRSWDMEQAGEVVCSEPVCPPDHRRHTRSSKGGCDVYRAGRGSTHHAQPGERACGFLSESAHVRTPFITRWLCGRVYCRLAATPRLPAGD